MPEAVTSRDLMIMERELRKHVDDKALDVATHSRNARSVLGRELGDQCETRWRELNNVVNGNGRPGLVETAAKHEAKIEAIHTAIAVIPELSKNVVLFTAQLDEGTRVMEGIKHELTRNTDSTPPRRVIATTEEEPAFWETTSGKNLIKATYGLIMLLTGYLSSLL